MAAGRRSWIDSLNSQIAFYLSGPQRKRTDSEFSWSWFEGRQRRRFSVLRSMARRVLRRRRSRSAKKSRDAFREWVNEKAAPLWSTRQMFEDDLSRLIFDMVLVLRSTGYKRFFIPGVHYTDYVDVASDEVFARPDLPREYIGLPLRVFGLSLADDPQRCPLKVVTTGQHIDMLNRTRQYLIRRPGVDMAPSKGDVVFDCGACIGEYGMVFAALCGPTGSVHMFDPVPLHTRFCELQVELNPALACVLRVNRLAVGEDSRQVVGMKADVDAITPGGLAVDSFEMTSIDDYAKRSDVRRVDMIKMDIEGAESAALEGARGVISEFKPKLAVCVYHKPDDFWEIPQRLKEQYGGYRLYFDHHSPVQWESVCYAIHDDR